MPGTSSRPNDERVSLDASQATFSKVGVDPCGRLFTWQDRIFRAIYPEMAENVRALFSCGLIQQLTDEHLFPKSWITEYSMEPYGLIIEHERIHPVSCPFEWSFEMLKAAALVVLKVNLVASKFGYQTKDCHTYNICFSKTTPVFVDLGSFIPVSSKRSWVSRQEFLKYYYYPLSLWAKGNSFIARKLLFTLNLLENMPHESYLLYTCPVLRFIPPSWLSRLVKVYHGVRSFIPFSVSSFNKLIRKISSLSLKKSETPWSSYHNAYYDALGEPISNSRFNRIIELIKARDINSVVELGGNQGFFSEVLLKTGSVRNVVCTDYDENAVDSMYRNAREKGLPLTSAVVDIMYPLMTYYETPPYERFRSDAAVALAVTHHIILSQHLPVELFFEIIGLYARKHVFIEFMPLGLWNGKTAPPVPSWYTEEWFQTAFDKYFILEHKEQLGENRILFIGEVR